MVTSVIDPMKVPTITLSQNELEELEDQIDAGNLPSDFLKRHYEAKAQNVFGAGFQRDSKGQPIEQGMGSASNMTRSSIDAYIRWCGPSRDRPNGEPGFAEKLKIMERQFAESEPRRKAAAEAARKESRELKRKYGHGRA